MRNLFAFTSFVFVYLLVVAFATQRSPEPWCPGCDWKGLKQRIRCGRFLKETNRSLPTLDDYMGMRYAYEQIVGIEHSTISPIQADDSILVPYRVDYIQEKGRGLFVTENVSIETPILNNHRQSARFPTVDHFKSFLQTIPPSQACDILVWFTVDCIEREPIFETVDTLKDENVVEDATTQTTKCVKAQAVVDLDNAALCNNGRVKHSNIGCPKENTCQSSSNDMHSCSWKDTGDEDYDCTQYTYAIRDIQEGQEILCNYEEYEFGWEVLEDALKQSMT